MKGDGGVRYYVGNVTTNFFRLFFLGNQPLPLEVGYLDFVIVEINILYQMMEFMSFRPFEQTYPSMDST